MNPLNQCTKTMRHILDSACLFILRIFLVLCVIAGAKLQIIPQSHKCGKTPQHIRNIRYFINFAIIKRIKFSLIQSNVR